MEQEPLESVKVQGKDCTFQLELSYLQQLTSSRDAARFALPGSSQHRYKDADAETHQKSPVCTRNDQPRKQCL
eukprot:1152292-Pelagomonas_calceolata.AAC.6